MEVFWSREKGWKNSCEKISQIGPPAAVTVGNFDGVHIGHRHLIHQLLIEAKSRTLKPVVVTFDPHPAQVLAKQPFSLLFSVEDRLAQLEKLGIQAVLVLEFNKAFSQVSAMDFLQNYLIKPFATKHLHLGYDFCFGKDREGNADFVVQRAPNLGGDGDGVSVSIGSAYQVDDVTVSSSYIRQLIAAGNVQKAEKLLARPYALKGEIERGDQLGLKLGFPTANLKLLQSHVGVIPAKGVYLSTLVNGDTAWPAITNVGTRPSVSNADRLSIETHILRYDGDLYGQMVEVRFHQRIREEKKFSSLEQLQQQIRLDIAHAEKFHF